MKLGKPIKAIVDNDGNVFIYDRIRHGNFIKETARLWDEDNPEEGPHRATTVTIVETKE